MREPARPLSADFVLTGASRLVTLAPGRVPGAQEPLGVVERGAMRYYLAIESFLEAPGRLEARLRDWYAAIERYPQLREEIGREEYVQMKSRPSAPSS